MEVKWSSGVPDVHRKPKDLGGVTEKASKRGELVQMINFHPPPQAKVSFHQVTLGPSG